MGEWASGPGPAQPDDADDSDAMGNFPGRDPVSRPPSADQADSAHQPQDAERRYQPTELSRQQPVPGYQPTELSRQQPVPGYQPTEMAPQQPEAPYVPRHQPPANLSQAQVPTNLLPGQSPANTPSGPMPPTIPPGQMPTYLASGRPPVDAPRHEPPTNIPPYQPPASAAPYQAPGSMAPYQAPGSAAPYQGPGSAAPYQPPASGAPYQAAASGASSDVVRYGPGVPAPGAASQAGVTAEQVWRTGRLPEAPRRRGRMRRTLGSALTVILLIAAGVVLYLRFHHAAFSVSDVKITSEAKTGCGVDVTGRIDTNGAAGTVHYQWEFQPQVQAPQPLSQSVVSGQHSVYVTVAVQGTGHGSTSQKVTLQVLGPGTASAATSVTFSC